MEYPDGFPNHLKPGIEAAIVRTQLKIPSQTSMRSRVKQQVCLIIGIVMDAVRSKEWDAESAHSGLKSLLRFLCVNDGYLNDYLTWSDFNKVMADIERDITKSKEWLACLEELAILATPQTRHPSLRLTPRPDESIAIKKTREDYKSERRSIRDDYLARIPEKVVILDICWAARQRYREWTRWIGGELKDGSKADKAFRAVMASGKRPEQYRPEQRPKDWK